METSRGEIEVAVEEEEIEVEVELEVDGADRSRTRGGKWSEVTKASLCWWIESQIHKSGFDLEGEAIDTSEC